MPTPAKWGPRALDSKDYLLYMPNPGSPITQPLIRIEGHSLTSPNQNLTDAVTYSEVQVVRGRVRVLQKTKRAAEENSRSYTIGLPSALWTPVFEQALRSGCETAFFMRYLCPDDEIYDHFYAFPESLLNPVIEAEDPITNTEDTNILTYTTELATSARLIGWNLGFSLVYTAAASNAYNDIVWKISECSNCDDQEGQELLAVGGDGVAVPLATNTENRFSTVTTLTSGAAAGVVSEVVYSDGNLIIIAERVSGTPDTGEIYVSIDNGDNFSQIAGATTLTLDIINAGGTILFVGGTTDNGGYVATSEDRGSTITAATSSAIPADQPLNAAAYDESTGDVYIVGGAGTVLKGRFSGSTLTLSDISSNLNTVNDLNTVIVRSSKEIVVGGAAGFASVSYDGGITWSTIATGSSSAVASIDGNEWRTIYAIGQTLYEQSALTNYNLEAITLDNGQTVSGTYTRVRINVDDFNRFAAVTDAGEVVLGIPYYPNA